MMPAFTDAKRTCAEVIPENAVRLSERGCEAYLQGDMTDIPASQGGTRVPNILVNVGSDCKAVQSKI